MEMDYETEMQLVHERYQPLIQEYDSAIKIKERIA